MIDNRQSKSVYQRIAPAKLQAIVSRTQEHLKRHFPTVTSAIPRLPFALVPFSFSQFILIEALDHQGWIDIFASWLVHATQRKMYPILWIMGVIGTILCNFSGTNIGATILLTKVARAANLPDHSFRAAAIALAVASNIGAVSFTFSASLAGLLWRQILRQKGIIVNQRTFAYWNTLPILVCFCLLNPLYNKSHFSYVYVVHDCRWNGRRFC
jgi:Na+/H+ antiporter NhaD/arsenite permease-like protein